MGESWLCFCKNGIITRKVAEETLPSTSRSRKNAEVLKRITYLTANTYNKFVSKKQSLYTPWRRLGGEEV
jgi:CRISPR/Cas system CSM-associated protein Csm4 (group 5 of RAMP superfamily)